MHYQTQEERHAMTTTATHANPRPLGTDLASDCERIACGQLVGWRCPICNRKMTRAHARSSRFLNIDHLIAHTLGGSNKPGNLIPLCARCNSYKNGHPLVKGLALAVLASSKTLSTEAGATRRVIRTDLVDRLVTLAAQCGDIMREMRNQ